MAHLEGEISNTLFEVLEEWNDILSYIDFDEEEPKQ